MREVWIGRQDGGPPSPFQIMVVQTEPNRKRQRGMVLFRIGSGGPLYRMRAKQARELGELIVQLGDEAAQHDAD